MSKLHYIFAMPKNYKNQYQRTTTFTMDLNSRDYSFFGLENDQIMEKVNQIDGYYYQTGYRGNRGGRGRGMHHHPRKTKEDKQKELISEYQEVQKDKLLSEADCLKDLPIYRSFKEELYSYEKIASEPESRKMHKLFLNVFPDGTKVTIKYSKKSINIFFEFFRSNSLYLANFQEVVKGNHQLKNFIEQQFIFGIYSKVYPRVPHEYIDLAKMAFYYSVSQKTQLKFTDKDFFMSKMTYKIFYTHSKTEDLICFTIINHRHDTASFPSIFLQERKNNYPQYYKLYTDFKHSITEDIENQQDWNFRGFGEIDSENEQEPNERLPSKRRLKLEELTEKCVESIKEILCKDMTRYDDKIKTLETIIDEEEQQDLGVESKNVMKSNYDELTELQKNIKEFQMVVDMQENSYKKIRFERNKNKKYESCKRILRRLKFAEKQLTTSLPILSHKQTIFKHLTAKQFLIIEGQTGSGKSTQLPQILCQFYQAYQNPQCLPVLITQPWKLATRTLAERVAAQMEENVHDFVDYQASFNSRKLNKNAKIIFKLDRIVVEELERDPLLSNYSCLVIYEAHERTLSIDIILGKIKQILSKRKDFKVIVTSASLDVKLFQEYYNSIPLKIPGRMFDVTELFIKLPENKSNAQKVYRVIKTRLMDKQTNKIKEKFNGHILVFCSGIEDIMETFQFLKEKLDYRTFKVLCLHPRLTPDQQRQAFKETNKIKIILATSLAETSITINGIKTVIDLGYDRQMVYNQQNKMYSMTENKISASSAKQRVGRAGRTMEGYCFRLYSEEDKVTMADNKPPEILNIALDNLVLRLKSLKVKDIVDFPYLTHPGKLFLENSIRVMKMIGCLDKHEKLTDIGVFLSKIPIEPLLGRAIIQSLFYMEAVQQLEQQSKKEPLKMKMPEQQLTKLASNPISQRIMKIISIVANSMSLYVTKEEEDKQKLMKVRSDATMKYDGDFLYLQQVYGKFCDIFANKSDKQLKEWAQSEFLSIKSLIEAKQTESQIKSILKKVSFDLSLYKQQISETKDKIKRLESASDCLVACLASSFLTNISLYSQCPEIGYTLISEQIPLKVANTSVLSINGCLPKWILAYEFFPNRYGQNYCRIAQKIDLELLKKTVSEEILNEYDILRAEQRNPFYQKLTKLLPTRVYIELSTAYKNRNNHDYLRILKTYTIQFNQSMNQVKIFCPRQSNGNQFVQVEGFINRIHKKFSQVFKYEYMGTIQAQIGPGLCIKSLQTKEPKCVITLFFDNVQIKEEFLKQLEKIEQIFIVNLEIENRIKIDIWASSGREKIKNLLRQFSLKSNKKIGFQEVLSNKRNKIPKFQLTIKFYTGVVDHDDSKVFLNYHPKSDEYFAITTKRNYSYLMEAKVKLIKSRSDHLLRLVHIKKSSALTGINLYFPRPKQPDEVAVQNLLIQWQKQGIISPQFEFPWKFMVFRKPESPYCNYPPEYWENILKQILHSQGVQQTNYVLKLKGWRARKGDTTVKQYVEFTATIQSFEQSNFKKIQRKYDRSYFSKLGIGKLNVKYEVVQNVGVIRNSVFIALKQEYLKLVKKMRKNNPELIFEASEPVLIKAKYRVFLKIRSQQGDKKKMSKLSEELSALFKPFTVKIQPKFNYMFDKENSFSHGVLTQSLEAEYNYKVYFIFDKIYGTLFAYAPSELQDEINQKIFVAMHEKVILSEQFSYKGISLSAVKNTVTRQQQHILQKYGKSTDIFCVFDVCYQNRTVLLTADVQTFQKLKHQIVMVTGKQKQQCEICYGNLTQPYKLFICGHQFCTLCLTQALREQSRQNIKQINCPLGCGERVSTYDINFILPEEQFDRICDTTVVNFVQSSPHYHSCYTPDCVQIFEASDSQLFSCQLCGIEYCKKCKNSHEGTQCVNLDEVLKKFKIKKCPKCGSGIEKNGGCNHITCASCKCHICWVCLECFNEQFQCYEHLRKVHGGFSDQFQEQMAAIDRVHERVNRRWMFER